ncbi:MAG: endonuclease/exonuclease/phosphatase family protein [Acidimicrobiales bacterium]
MAETPVIVATFNLHAGMDGYGRRFDVIEACRHLSADVLFLQEVFYPADGPSQAQEIGDALGLNCFELRLAQSWRIRSELATATSEAWEPRRPYPRARRALRVGGSLKRDDPSRHAYDEGMWGLAVLTRESAVSSEALELGRLRRDFTSRAALSVRLQSGLVVVGTHMAHFTHGSAIHLRHLGSALPPSDDPAILGGDMNFWGPPIEALLWGWRRAARGKTWPSWRPRHQLDHLFVTRSVRSVAGGPVRAGNSDHLPLRAQLFFGAAASSQVSGRE